MMGAPTLSSATLRAMGAEFQGNHRAKFALRVQCVRGRRRSQHQALRANFSGKARSSGFAAKVGEADE